MEETIPSSLLEAFVAVVQHGSVTVAAQKLGRSQPAISQRLRQLEEHLGVKLLQPSGRGLMLTRDGELLFEYARDILAKLRELPRLVDAMTHEPRGVLRVGALPTLTRYVLVDAIETIAVHHPEVQLRVELGLEADLLAKLRDGWLDGMYFIGQVDMLGLISEKLADVHMCVTAAPGMFLKAPSLEDLRSHRLLLWRGPSDPSFALVERHARAGGLVQPNTVEVAHIETLKALAERGVGYTLLPDYVVLNEVRSSTLRVFEFPGFPVAFPMHLHRISGRPLSRAMQVFADCVRETTKKFHEPSEMGRS